MANELFNARLFVSTWFNKLKGFKMKPGGNFKGNSKILQDTMLLDYEEMVNAKSKEVDPNTGHPYKIKSLKENSLKSALHEFLQQEAIRVKDAVIAALLFNSEPDTELVRWLGAIVENPTTAQINVLKHTLWLIKRKALGRSVVHHICPVFFGVQGSGKTWAVNQILKPVVDLKLEWDIPSLIDSRNTPMLEDNLVVLLDEMAGVKWADLGELKRRITNETLDYRVLSTHRQIKVNNNCTVIGLSNKAISDVINDQTGNRRFFQYNCKDKTDRMVLSGIDVLKIWKCVDENLERGYFELSEDEIQQIQHTYQLDGELQSFIKDAELKTDGKRAWIHAKAIYEYYLIWKHTSGFRNDPTNSILSLGRALQTAGFQGAVKYLNGRHGTAYLINENSPVFKKEPLQEAPKPLTWSTGEK